jgi:hypothetical protein
MGVGDTTTHTMYGISRIDDPVHRTFAWRVSLCRRGKKLIKNFTDKKHGGKEQGLELAKKHRDELLVQNPPISRKEFSCVIRSNNKTGISGVYKYAKRYTLRNGTEREVWYWEANWPTEVLGVSGHQSFSVNRFGEEVARQMAIREREQGLSKLSGVFWASERGILEQERRETPESFGTAAGNSEPQELHVA